MNSIDIQPMDDDQLRRMFAQHGVGENVELIIGDSQRTKYPQIGAFDLLFIDGDHSYDGCSRDLENFYGELAPGGHIVLHDCFFGCAVQDAVIDFLDRHPEVRPVISPYTVAAYWNQPQGSLAHLRKPVA
jgi:predicted O-methyltransferase YrrM